MPLPAREGIRQSSVAVVLAAPDGPRGLTYACSVSRTCHFVWRVAARRSRNQRAPGTGDAPGRAGGRKGGRPAARGPERQGISRCHGCGGIRQVERSPPRRRLRSRSPDAPRVRKFRRARVPGRHILPSRRRRPCRSRARLPRRFRRVTPTESSCLPLPRQRRDARRSSITRPETPGRCSAPTAKTTPLRFDTS